MELLKEKIQTLSGSIYPEMKAIRRHLHQHPELSKHEFETANFICRFLEKEGIAYTSGVGGNGIVALIKGKNPDKKVIALRADMDALPIIEENAVPYKSMNTGVMHACGHDVHITCLLGASKLLNDLKDNLEGTIKLIFQPSEEEYPGGALMMIKDGVLENPSPLMIFGQHVLPGMQVGKVGMRAGKYMASTDEIYFTVKGRGGHGATPELNIDPIVIAAQIILALQQVVSRIAKPTMPTVFTIGRVIADGRTNVTPSEVKMDGILRTFNEDWRKEAHEKITHIAQTVAKAYGGECEVFVDHGYPFLVNDEKVTALTCKLATEYLGAENVLELDERMTAEDFAYFTQKVPACFYRLGVTDIEGRLKSNLHSSTFDVDEKSIEIGIGLMTWLAVNALNSGDEAN
jgi:amidohydrolase